MLGWHYNKSGIYSVKKAYWLATHLPENEEIVTPSGSEILNKAIWKLQKAPKIKHFLWKVISRSLPTGEVLKRRHISRDSLCLRCCQHEETANHMLNKFGEQLGLSLLICMTPLISVEAKLETLVLDPALLAAKENKHIVVWILWRLWKSRNKLIFQRKTTHWRSLVRYGKNDATEYLNSQENYLEFQKNSARATPVSNRQGLWKRPPYGWIKCNFDGSFRNRHAKSSAGWVLRDNNGVHRGSGQAMDDKETSALEGEFQALIIAMQNAWIHGHRKIIFEGDCKQLVDLMNKVTLNFAMYNWLLEAWYWQNKCHEAIITWIPREENRVAHKLAK